MLKSKNNKDSYFKKKKKSFFKTNSQRSERFKELNDYFWKKRYEENNISKLEKFLPSERKNIISSLYKTEKLNSEDKSWIFRQVNIAYGEEIKEKKSLILYYQKEAGFPQPKGDKIVFRKSQKLTQIFPQKGEHKSFFPLSKKIKEFQIKLRETKKSKRKFSLDELLKISKEAYYSSPKRIRDRNLIGGDGYTRYKLKNGILNKVSEKNSFGVGEVYEKWIKENHSKPTRKHYIKAMIDLLRNTETDGEKVKDNEIEYSNNGKVVLKDNQIFSIESDKPGKNWEIRKNASTLEEKVDKDFHEKAHQGYIEEYGTKTEIEAWNQRKEKKSLCWVEYTGGNCIDNQGGSEFWCLQCVRYGPQHPPELPIHCPWQYTYNKNLCGIKKDVNSTAQWHLLSDGDLRTCHIGIYSPNSNRKNRRK